MTLLTNQEIPNEIKRASLRARWYLGEITSEDFLKEMALLEELDGKPSRIPFPISVKTYYESMAERE